MEQGADGNKELGNMIFKKSALFYFYILSSPAPLLKFL